PPIANAEPALPAAPEASAQVATATALDAPTQPTEPEPDALAPKPRVPSRRELKEAQRTTKRAHRYLRSERYERAAAAYKGALALAPEYAPALIGLTRVHLHDRDATEALRYAERLAALAPDDKVTQLLLGDAHALSGDSALATEAWRRSAKLG